jgi:hypothetical protein
MGRIRIIDKGADARHYDFEYAVADAARSFFLGQYPVACEGLGSNNVS